MEDKLSRLLQASHRLQRIINAKRELMLAGGCEAEIEKLDDKIRHLRRIENNLQEQSIEQAII